MASVSRIIDHPIFPVRSLKKDNIEKIGFVKKKNQPQSTESTKFSTPRSF